MLDGASRIGEVVAAAAADGQPAVGITDHGNLYGALPMYKAARDAGVRHFIYLSVAQPASMMQAFVAVRAEGEALLRASGMKATFVRPWYVLGPGHWWPYALVPFYWVAELLPATREPARRLGLVTISQMLKALVWSVENPPDDIRILDVPKIKELSRRS